jgi:sugar diacid utilization regulator
MTRVSQKIKEELIVDLIHQVEFAVKFNQTQETKGVDFEIPQEKIVLIINKSLKEINFISNSEHIYGTPMVKENRMASLSV